MCREFAQFSVLTLSPPECISFTSSGQLRSLWYALDILIMDIRHDVWFTAQFLRIPNIATVLYSPIDRHNLALNWTE